MLFILLTPYHYNSIYFSENNYSLLQTLLTIQDLSDQEIERYFNYAAVWALAGTLEVEHREAFSQWWKQTFKDYIDYPSEGTVCTQYSSLFLPPWQKEVMFLVTLVCLHVCEQHYSKSYKRITVKFYGWVRDGERKNSLNFGRDLGLLR